MPQRVAELVGIFQLLAWLAHGAHDEPHSRDHKRDAEQLALIEAYRLAQTHLPGLLHILEELDEEAGAKDANKEPSQYQALALLGIALPVEPHAQGKDEQVAQRLIDLGGVAGLGEHRLGTLHIGANVVDEAESPGLAGGAAIDLVVHQVANADERAHEANGDAQAVEGPQHAFLGNMPAVEDDGDNDSQRAAVARQAAFPHLEDVGRMLRVVTPVVEEHMSQPCAHDGGNHHIEEQRSEPFLGRALVLEDAVNYLVANKKSNGKHQSIPAHGNGAREQVRIGCPSDEINHCHKSLQFFGHKDNKIICASRDYL